MPLFSRFILIPRYLLKIDFNFCEDLRTVEIESRVNTCAKTGVEMEALTAVSVAALTLYDMCKALDKGIVIQNIRLMKKTGGRSGTYLWNGKKEIK